MNTVEINDIVTLIINNRQETTCFLSNEESEKYKTLSPISEITEAILGKPEGTTVNVLGLNYKVHQIVIKNYNIEKEKEEILKQQRLEQERLREEQEKHEALIREKDKEYYDVLINAIKNYHPGFEGLLHTTEVENFIQIMQMGNFMSRSMLEENNTQFIDRADREVIANTDDFIKECCRFYYKEKAPTNYNAHYERPVIMVFSPELFKSENAYFSTMNSAKNMSRQFQGMKSAAEILNFKEILERGPHEPGDWEKTAYRNCDFLYHGIVSTDMIIKVYFNTPLIKSLAENILGENPMFEVNPNMFE